MKRIFLTIFVVLFISIVKPHIASAANSFDLSDPANWNFRYDGKDAYEQIGYFEIASGDVNNDGENDLLITSYYRYDTLTEGTTTFVIYSTLLDSLSGKGNIIDLADESNYNLKILPGASGDYQEYYSVSVAKLNNNSLSDLVIGHGYGSYGGESLNGVVNVIYDSIIDDFSGTGNTIDLSNPAHYNLKLFGADSSHYFGYSNSTAFDLNSDGRKDLVISADNADYNSKTNSGSTYVIFSSLLDSYGTTTGNDLSMSTDTNYNIRYDGPDANDWLETYVLSDSDADLNGDGKDELIIYNPRADFSGTDAGSFFIIDNTLIDDHTGTGNEVNLATTSNYTVRYDAAGGDDGSFGYSITLLSDYNEDGQTDLILAHTRDDNNGKTDSGSVYFISGELYSNFSGTGNTALLSDSGSYNTRIDGPNASDNFGWDMTLTDFTGDGYNDLIVDSSTTAYIVNSSQFRSNTSVGNTVNMSDTSKYIASYDTPSGFASAPYTILDLNNDGKTDLFISDPQTDYSDTSSGSVYVIYNYPHTISASASPGYSGSNSRYTITGTITAPDSVTTTAGVEFQIDLNDPLEDWSSCTADDGTFDSTSEDFTCHTDTLSAGLHTIYIRTFDENNSYTAMASYEQISVTVVEDTPTPTPIPSPTVTPTSHATPSLVLNSIENTQVVNGVLTYMVPDGKNITFSGVSNPFANITITVHSNPLICTTTANTEGVFSCTFSEIPDGYHDVYIVATNAEGIITNYPKIVLGVNIELSATGKSFVFPIIIGGCLLISLLIINIFPIPDLCTFYKMLFYISIRISIGIKTFYRTTSNILNIRSYVRPA